MRSRAQHDVLLSAGFVFEMIVEPKHVSARSNPPFERARPRTISASHGESSREGRDAGGAIGRSPTRRRGRASAGRGWREGKQVGRIGRKAGRRARGAEEANGHPRLGGRGPSDGPSRMDPSSKRIDQRLDIPIFRSELPLVCSRLVPSKFDVFVPVSFPSIVRVTAMSFH